MQFPVLCWGRPVKGLQGEVEGLDYTREICWRYNKQVLEYYSSHKNGPYVYSEWSSIPDEKTAAEEIPRWFRYLRLYRPMVEEGSVCYIDIKESALFKQKPEDNIYASLFVNGRVWLVISNLGGSARTVALARIWRDRESGAESDTFEVGAGKILFLEDIKI